jgi:pyrroloquinoline quinone (PQQ) biosynthesis protein C
VRRIEKGEGTTYEALRRLASAHGMDLKSYLRELAVNASEPALEKAIA